MWSTSLNWQVVCRSSFQVKLILSSFPFYSNFICCSMLWGQDWYLTFVGSLKRGVLFEKVRTSWYHQLVFIGLHKVHIAQGVKKYGHKTKRVWLILTKYIWFKTKASSWYEMVDELFLKPNIWLAFAGGGDSAWSDLSPLSSPTSTCLTTLHIPHQSLTAQTPFCHHPVSLQYLLPTTFQFFSW